MKVSSGISELRRDVSLDVGFCFYERSLETVQRAIESVKDHVRYIFAIDGKFEFFQSDKELSSLMIREYLLSIPNVKLVDFPNRKENEKRQVYLDLAKEYLSDWLLILDADEFITDETDWHKVYEALMDRADGVILPEIYGVTLRQDSGKHKELAYPRMWFRPYLIEYLKTHNFWKFTPDGTVYKSSTSWNAIPGIFMKGNDKHRDMIYTRKSYEYQVKLMKYEKPFKEEYRKIAKNTKSYTADPRLPGIPLT